MNSKLLLLVAVLLLSPIVNAESKSLWVVGSFKSEYYAAQEVERIQDMTGLECQLVRAVVTGQEVYRLVTEKPSSTSIQEQTKAALAAIGIEDVWTLHPGPGDQVMFAKSRADDRKSQPQAMTAPTPAPTPPPPVRTFKPKVVSTEPPFAPDNQSYFEFCMSKATATQRRQYCGNQAFSDRARQDLTPKQQKLVQRSRL